MTELATVEVESAPSPSGPLMRHAYVSECGNAHIILRHMAEDDWEVQRVFTTGKSRRQGLQRELWKALLADADAEGVHLLLNVGMGHRQAMSREQLMDWYARMGFNGIMDVRMERVPGGDQWMTYT